MSTKRFMQQGSSVMLTGGRTAEALYRSWADNQPWDHANIW